MASSLDKELEKASKVADKYNNENKENLKNRVNEDWLDIWQSLVLRLVLVNITNSNNDQIIL